MEPPGDLRVNAGVVTVVWLAGNTVWSTPEQIKVRFSRRCAIQIDVYLYVYLYHSFSMNYGRCVYALHHVTCKDGVRNNHIFGIPDPTLLVYHTRPHFACLPYNFNGATMTIKTREHPHCSAFRPKIQVPSKPVPKWRFVAKMGSKY